MKYKIQLSEELEKEQKQADSGWDFKLTTENRIGLVFYFQTC